MDALLKNGYSLGGFVARTLKNEYTPNFAEGSHEFWMDRALQIAMNGVGWSAPNPAVGCCIVRDSQLIAEGFTQAYRHEHAERMAMAQVDWEQIKLSDQNSKHSKSTTAYVTLEPCAHFGSQPPCVDLLLNSPIDTVVIGCQDPDERVNGLGIEKLKAAGKTVIVGVLANEVRAWHFPFLHSKTISRPVWVGKWAQTEDGHLANIDGESKWITNPKSRAYTHWLRQKYDAILVGATTWLKDEPSLSVRDCASPHRRNPVRLVFDPSGKILQSHGSDSSAYFQKSNAPLKIFICEEVLESRKGQIPEHPDLEVVSIAAPLSKREPSASSSVIELKLLSAFQAAVHAAQYERPLQSVFVEGGAQLLNNLLRYELLESVHQFIAPFSFERSSDQHRITWQPNSRWQFLAQYKFDGDCLHEWVKWS